MLCLRGAPLFSGDRMQDCFETRPNSVSKQNKQKLFESACALWKVLEYDPRILSQKKRRNFFVLKNLSICMFHFDPTQLSDWFLWSRKGLLFKSKELHSEEGWSRQIQLKLCLGQPQCDSCPNCRKSPFTVLSVILDTELNIWTTLAIWEVTYSPTLDLKSQTCLCAGDVCWQILTVGLRSVLMITAFISAGLLCESLIFFFKKNTQEWCD